MTVHPRYGRRAEKTKRAVELRARGLSRGEIAADLGISTTTVSAYLNDPDGSRYEERIRRNRGICEECGRETSHRTKRLCGLCARTGSEIAWTRERVIEAIRLWFVTYGEPPKCPDWQPRPSDSEAYARFRRLRKFRKLVPCASVVYKRFGSWPAALEAAGFQPKPPRRRKKKTHCKQGHEFTPENTYHYPDGHRGCRICARESRRRHKPLKGSATHCKRGHSLDDAIIDPKTGWRRCRTCKIIRRRAMRGPTLG